MKTICSQDVFRSLPVSVRDQLLKGAGRVQGRKGQTLITKGDLVSGVFLVLSGRLRIYAMNAEGKQATLYRLKDDELCLLSLNSTLTGGRYPAWVNVESDTVDIVSLKGETFRALFAREPGIQDLILGSLTTTVADLLVRMDEMLLSGLEERIRSFLLNNADPQGHIQITHQELADHLGVTREAVSRELSTLKARGVITTGRTLITLVQ